MKVVRTSTARVEGVQNSVWPGQLFAGQEEEQFEKIASKFEWKLFQLDAKCRCVEGAGIGVEMSSKSSFKNGKSVLVEMKKRGDVRNADSGSSDDDDDDNKYRHSAWGKQSKFNIVWKYPSKRSDHIFMAIKVVC